MMSLTPGLKPKLKIVNQLYMHTKILDFCCFYSHASTAAKYHREFLELSFLIERRGCSELDFTILPREDKIS